MAVKIWALDRKLRGLTKPIKRSAEQLLNLFKRADNFLEIYLVNRRFMNKNVLAFRAPKNFPRPDINGRSLGEIYLNPQYIKRHRENIFFMLAHGFLHLLGYDHQRKSDRLKMEEKEQQLLKLLK